MGNVEGWTTSVLVTLVLAACGDGSQDSTSTETETSTSDGSGSTIDLSVTNVDSGPDEAPDGSGDTDEPADCETADDCLEPTTPACVGGLCLGCDHALVPDGRCFAMDESRPLCGPDGACVQCTADDLSVCTETTPLCDAATSLCVGCTAHDQCPGTACDKETGACFPSDCVLHIDSDGGQDYESISAALDGSMDEYRCVLVVHRPAAGATYSEDLEVGGRHIAILGEGIGRPRLASSQSEHVLSADSASVVYLSGLHVIQGQILVEYATVSIEDTDITNNFGPAIRTTSPSSRVKLENALIDGNDFLDEGAIALEAGDLEGVFSTVLGDDRALRCVPPAAAVVRNSLLLNSGDQLAVECPTFEATYSAFEVEYSGDGNQPLGEFQYEWFVFDDSVRRLSETSPALLAVTARWTTGDPTTDIDGDERPDRDGTMHYAGADVPD